MKKKIQLLSVLAFIALTTLSVKSTAQTIAPAAAASWKLTGNAGTDTLLNFVGTTDKNPLIFRTKNVEKMRILVGGNVGIGTTKPGAKLNIYSNATVSLTGPGMLMLGKETASNMAFDFNVIQARTNGAASSLYFNYYGGNTYVGPSAALQISSSNMAMYGIAGINGASSASYALNVNSGSISGIQVTDPLDNYVLYAYKTGINDGIYVTKSSTATGTASIEGNATGSGNGVDGTANTGVGVYGSSSSNNGVYGNSFNNEGVYGYTGGGGNIAGVHGYCASTGYGVWGQGTSGSGIYGTTSAGSYAGYFVGNVYSTGTYVGSDLKLKKNITDLTSAMDIINQLHPKKYDFRDDGNYQLMHLPKGNHFGLIAQEVEKILPNIVQDTKFETANSQADANLKQPSIGGKENSANSVKPADKTKSEEIDFKAVNYTELIPIIIKGMQEQQAVIEKQQQEIDELQQMVKNNTSGFSSTTPKSAEISGTYLLQNAPNPFSQNTTVRCYVPSTVQQAKLAVYNMNGQLIKTFSLTSGMNTVTISAGTLSSGQYTYTLLADGKKVDSKNMIMTQ